jgi:NAD(P)H-flavin reductase
MSILLGLLSSCVALSFSGAAPVLSWAAPIHTIGRSSCICVASRNQPVWADHVIESIEDAAEGLKAITIQPSERIAEGFTNPGQYIQIRQPGTDTSSSFAIASAPGAAGPFELLIKEAPPTDLSPGNRWLTGAEVGTEIEMSHVMGGGVSLADHIGDVDRVLLFAAGSGISPIRSVIESRMLDGREVELYYGMRTPAHAAYWSKLETWNAFGVEYTLCVSTASKAPLQACVGYVQDVAKDTRVFANAPDRTLLLMCGMKGMMAAVSTMATDAGIAKARVLTNF